MTSLKKVRILLSLLAAVAVLAPNSARAEKGVRVTGPQTLQLVDEAGQQQAEWTVEATIQDVLQLGDTLYVACGPSGVLIFDLTTPAKPSLVGRLAGGRNVVKLAHNGQSLLVMVADYSALTFSLADPRQPAPTVISPLGGLSGGAAPPPPPANPAGPPPQRELPLPPEAPRAPQLGWARVTKVRGGSVAIEAPSPVQVGDRFVIRSQRRVRVSDPTSAHPLYAPSNQAMGMFVVTQASGDIGSGPLPRGTVAEVGDLAEPTAAPLRTPKVAPRLWYGMGRFYGTLRPLIEVGTLSTSSGLGMLSELTFEYYFRVPIKLGVQLAPMGLVTGSSTGFSGELRALLSFASSYFELGLEPGVELHRIDQPLFLIGYGLRLGSLDGLNLILHNSYGVVSTYNYNTFKNSALLDFASATGEINIPLASRFNLYLTGGGSAYWAYGTIGLKYYLRGGGGPGTLIFQSALGGAWVSDRCRNSANTTRASYCQSASAEAVGPVLALGIDARF